MANSENAYNITKTGDGLTLINYLSAYFYNKEQLLQRANISESKFEHLTKLGIMPKPSYKITLGLTCQSALGEYDSSESLEYFAKGYTRWLVMLKELARPEDARTIFAQDYAKHLSQLKCDGFNCLDDKVDQGLELHIQQEWQHFSEGTYGLCTRSGLVQDIVAKELASMIINELLQQAPLNQQQTQTLNNAVNLLDNASALFAPHERARSSRQKLVLDVRQQFNLPGIG